MPNPYPIELRERAVRAYEAGDGTYAAVADRFSVNLWTLWRWVQRRATGTVAACDKRGGWSSPVVLEVMHAIVPDTPDATTQKRPAKTTGTCCLRCKVKNQRIRILELLL